MSAVANPFPAAAMAKAVDGRPSGPGFIDYRPALGDNNLRAWGTTTDLTNLQAHSLADAFPLIEGAEFDQLQHSLVEDGQLTPIALFEGCILDGRNRYRACQRAGIKPKFVEFVGDAQEAARFVIAANVRRRHLSESQRAMLAADLIKAGATPDEALAIANVSQRSLNSAKRVQRHAPGNVVALVRSGDLAVSTAAAMTTILGPDELAAIGSPQDARAAAKVFADTSATKRAQTLRKGLSLLRSLALHGNEIATALPAPEIPTLREEIQAAMNVLVRFQTSLASRRVA